MVSRCHGTPYPLAGLGDAHRDPNCDFPSRTYRGCTPQLRRRGVATTRPWAGRLSAECGGLRTAAPAGAIRLELDHDVHSGVSCWSGRDRWVRYVVPIAWDLRAATHVRPAMGANPVSRAAVLAVAAARARYADTATGRNCRPTVARLAADTGLSERTVQRADAALRLLGVATEVLRGRLRTLDERLASWRVGDKGRGWSSVYVLHEDAALARAIATAVTPPGTVPRRGTTTAKSLVTTSDRQAGSSGATRRNRPDSGGMRLARAWRADRNAPPWAQHHSAAAWAAVLAAPAAAGWTPRDLNTVIDDWARVRGWLPADPHRPIGLLGAVVAWHGDPAVRPAAQDEAREAADLAAARARIAAQFADRETAAEARVAARAALGGAGHTAARVAAAQIAARAAAKRAAGAAVELDAAAALVAAVRG